VPGKEIVQLYVAPESSAGSRPVKELKGFTKTGLLWPGASETLHFTLDERSFAYYNTDLSDWYVETGDYQILLGASSTDIWLDGAVHVTGTKQIRRVYTADSRMGELMADPKAAQVIGMLMGGHGGQSGATVSGQGTQEEADQSVPAWEQARSAAGTTAGQSEGVLSQGGLDGTVDAKGGASDSPASEASVLPDEDSADDAMNNEAIGMDMPLGKLVNFSGGALTYDRLEMLLDVLNQTNDPREAR
ncbi:MAG: fibronectin type III-like domain-contianing protein, partial [Lachnospiraceae bacterium]|nr:fibronectin type III-like domain-contianing protein [Lachnospiraceae bacterium]